MKLFKNLLIATAAVAVFTGVSAFAEEATDNTNYDFTVDATNVATNVVSVTSTEIAGVIADLGDQVTVVVVPAGATTISEANIYYINQDANGNATAMLTSMGTKTLAADTDYEVWVGGSNGTIKKGTFSTTVGEEVQLGDVNFDDTIDGFDLTEVVNHITLLTELTEGTKKYFVANVNGDDTIDGFDLTAIVNDITNLAKLGTATFIQQ